LAARRRQSKTILAMSVIKAVGVTKKFDTGAASVDAVRGIDISIEAGEMVAIVGPSGSGKSTLLTLLGAIDTPTTGQVFLDGVDVATLDDYERTLFRRRRIGFVFQAFNLIPTLTALENVALPLELDDVTESRAVERSRKMLELVSLSHRADHLPNMMSGGEQQRVAVARALVTKPALVLADEPTGNLDSVNSQAVMQLLRDLVDTHGQTVVIVTHDMLVAADADRIIHVRDGMIQYEESQQSPLSNNKAPRPAVSSAERTT
jgi:putative ABC transport system ATP-binding protein